MDVGGRRGDVSPTSPSAPHPSSPDHRQLVFKANAKQAVDLGNSREGQQYLVARGCCHVPEDLSRGLLGLILKKLPACSTRWLVKCST